MSSNVRRWVVRIAPPLLVGAVPAALLSLGVARFMLNHFFARAPYLLDSGLLSGVVYRSGPLLAPPAIACDYATSFYQVYFSPIISVFSALSYVVPVDRIEWFAFVEAMVFFPLGIAGYMLASRVEPAGLLRRLPIAMVAALSFGFSGLVVWMVGYPHYEAATPGLVCLVLVALVTGRTRLSWVLLALAASVRQDGGFHVALALTPLLYLRWRGTVMPPSLRRLLATFAVAIGASVVAIVCQKLFFAPVDRLGYVYFGKPAYSHLSVSLLIDRVEGFVVFDQVIYYPFLATLLIAVLRRDMRYLLGWGAALPWFLFNFTARDGAKSVFVAYTAGPFLVSIFWVYLYGGLLAPARRRLRPGVLEAAFALICASSTLGHYRAVPSRFELTARNMAFSHPWHRSAVHGFVDALHRHRAGFGRLYVDDGVAALSQEWLHLGELWHSGDQPAPDTLAFHDRGTGVELVGDLIANQLDVCSHVLDTHIFVCSRERLPAGTLAGIATETLPSMFAFAELLRPGIWVGDRGLVVLAGFSFDGGLGPLARGTYEWTLTLATDVAPALDRAELVHIEIGESPGGGVRPSLRPVAIAPSGAHDIAVRFDADGAQPLAYRVTSRSSLVRITGARLRRVEAR